MRCEVKYTDEFDEFEEWWNALGEDEQAMVDAYVKMLEQYGVGLGYPHSSDVKKSKYGQMRELRAQHQGRPYRVLYATREGWQFCWSAAIKQAMTDGMINLSRWLMTYMRII